MATQGLTPTKFCHPGSDGGLTLAKIFASDPGRGLTQANNSDPDPGRGLTPANLFDPTPAGVHPGRGQLRRGRGHLGLNSGLRKTLVNSPAYITALKLPKLLGDLEAIHKWPYK